MKGILKNIGRLCAKLQLYVLCTSTWWFLPQSIWSVEGITKTALQGDANFHLHKTIQFLL
jgi:hypothetical protein